ncbi:glutamate:Na+ symporter, ESS family [Caminicella sporogenes DSM 14501]|uniref:Sodium/glutamate symporter n=1 Tax=Caminicella sporogenes DSM 14501 TaxID=1121266 RepID=A0A1M6P2Y4_9FIRM|nr:sodium/glutamate symporter [Caminicella sporogenes]RKD21549.1 sodium/glutamate symporter [Caminicella sporogenes]SHK02274.1 glutamate:Na+ symporter, ESS family [Caminicella sporogenes DSM 14501]
MVFKLNMVQTLSLAVIVLFLGQGLKKRISLLEKFCIPAPVIGGLVFAIMTLIFRQTGILTFEMDTTLQKLFMTAFFTTVGFTASFKLLKKGGIQVFIFLGLAIVLVTLQNVVGVGLAKLFKLNPLIGLCTGSVPMTGGHGTSGAFAPLFEKAGATAATTVAMAAATFGLIMGSMIGGPIGKRLIEKHNLLEKKDKGLAMEEVAVTMSVQAKELIPNNFMIAASQIILAMGFGTILSYFLQKTGLTFPPYIGAMFAAAIIRNISDLTNFYRVCLEEIEIIGNISLSLFLSMALMGLKLWQLADLAVPLVVMLLAQAVLMGLFAYFITFNIMGRDYEAAVMACGHCGFGMGATPNAMANMSALSEKYGPAPRAFFILPLIGSLFIDFFNAGIITFFMNLFK